MMRILFSEKSGRSRPDFFDAKGAAGAGTIGHGICRPACEIVGRKKHVGMVRSRIMYRHYFSLFCVKSDKLIRDKKSEGGDS